MLVNSIKTKNNFHNYIVIKQSDNTSAIEILLCGANGSILSDLNQSCTLTILDEVDGLIRQKTTEQIVNGTVTFRVTNDLKTNPHTLEITTADGQKFPSNHDFKIFVSYTHDESELKIINNLSREEALAEIDQSVKQFISENTEEYIDKVATSKWLYENNFKPKEAVTTFNDLPKNAELKELRGVLDENAVYVYDGLKWVKQSELNFDGLGEVKDHVGDLAVNVRKFKRNDNSWNDALQLAIDHANALYSAQSELGGLYVPQNVLLKMPRGRYTISKTLIGRNGIDYDFSGCVFVASPTDKTVDFLDYTGSNGGGKIFRSHFNKGNFVGFKKVLPFLTGNIDTSNLVWDNPTFQSCLFGIDSINYKESRSTYIKITNLYSIYTDTAIKSHTDMTSIEGGWFQHSGNEVAAIYNQSNMEINDVVFVPTPPKNGAKTRWIDNHSEDAGSNDILGTRGLIINHCRFSGEEGSCPTIFNYATHTKNNAAYTASIIKIDGCMLNSVGTVNKAAIVLFAMPNRISITNVTGMTYMSEGLIKVDPSFNIDAVQTSPEMSIELDESTYHHNLLMDKRLEKFLKRYKDLNDMFRHSFEKGFYGQQKCTSTADGKPKFSFKVNFGDNAPSSHKMKGQAFLMTLSSGAESFYYKGVSTYIVHLVGNYVTELSYGIAYAPLLETGGGYNKGNKVTIKSIHWGTGDTGKSELPYKDGAVIDGNITVVLSGGEVDTAGVSIIPLFGF